VKTAGEEPEDPDEDCFHPRSPLVDCLAGILLAKRQALRGEDKAERERAASRVRQATALCNGGRLTAPVPDSWAADLLGVLRPELRELTSEDEIHGFLHTLSINRFGSADSQLDLMFAGSMFEHSCVPNCFVGTWRGAAPEQARLYRALCDIAEGEALAIDYLLLPDGYRPAAGRAELLGRWGFACSCPRCTTLPEVTRCFVCPACQRPELCPRRPGPDAELACLACGKAAEAAYAQRCLAVEAALYAGAGEDEEAPELGDEAEQLLGRLHHAAFAGAWLQMLQGPSEATAEGLAEYREAVELLVDGTCRLYGNPKHPHLLDLYHVLAELEHGNLDGQRHFLELERSVLRRYYPEEAEKQDDEIMTLVQGRGRQPAAGGGAAAEDWGDFCGTGSLELGTMD